MAQAISEKSSAYGTSLGMMALLLLLLVGITGCTGIKRDTLPPEVSLSKVELISAGLFEQRWQLTLRTYNPNSYPLRLRGLKYLLFVEGNEMARGASNEKVTLPGNGDTLVSTQVTTNIMQVLSQMQAIQKNNGEGGADGLVDYRIDGSVILGSMPLPLSFSHEGKTKLPALY